MLTLYVKTGCPFCAKVLHTVDELGIDVEQKNIADDAVAAELVEKGGKRQVPYLIDAERDVAMYESDDIVTYFEKHYGAERKEDQEVAQEVKMDDSFLDNVKVAPRVHRSPDAGVCEACEG